MSPAREASLRRMVTKEKHYSANIAMMAELLAVIDGLRESILRIERSMDGIRTEDNFHLTGEPGGL